MSFAVEQATLADAADMAALHYLSHTKSFAAFASAEFVATRKLDTYLSQWTDSLRTDKPGARAWVARANGAVVGIVRVYPMPEQGLAQLGGMHVHPDQQGRGVGRALMMVAEAFIRESGYRRCVLGVVEANVRARRLYDGMGWHAIETHPVGVEGVPYCVYEKSFGASPA